MAVPGVESSISASSRTGFSRATDSQRRAPRRLLVAAGAALALVLVACGGGEEDGEPAAAGGNEQEPADEGAESPEAPEPAAGAVVIAAADEPPSEGGVRTHRAADAADPDCASIPEDDPGARILFPGDGTLDAGAGPVTVEILGCGNTFEGNVQWEAFHGQNRTPTLEGFTQGGSMGDWEEFRFSDTYWTAGDWTVVVFEVDAASGDRREYDQVTFTIG